MTVEYFQRGELWTTQAPPVLLAAATLQVMLSNSHMAYRECYSKAVKLLEYIHSECPKAGMDEDYIDLLVDLKTKVSQVPRSVNLISTVPAPH